MTARREPLLQVTDVFTDFFCIICNRKVLPTRFSLWEGLSGSPVRRSTRTRAKWRLLRCPKGGEMICYVGWNSAEREELNHVENWSYCYGGSGWPVTTAAAIEAEYLPKGGLNGCSLALDGRPQSFLVFISVFGCHGSRCPACQMGRDCFGCWTVEEKCQRINFLILILSPDSSVSTEVSGKCVGPSSISQGETAQVRVWTHWWVCVVCGAAFSLHVVTNKVRFVFL